jgi:hypothetical protein
MKKRLIALFLILAGAGLALASDPLATAIQKKDWPALAALFSDETHQQLVAYFNDCQGVGFNLLRPDDLMFFVRFRDFAEIGELTFVYENGRYRQLNLKRNIKPLYFVDSFSRYEVTDRILRMGDAEINFKKGAIYRGQPMSNLFIFVGSWEFRIKPDSEEERLTLRNLVRSDTFAKDAQAGIFVCNQADFLEGLPAPLPASALEEGEAQALYEIVKQRWGMHVPFFNELWYFSFAADFNAAIFHNKPGKSYYRYIFNGSLAPDTSLVLFPENKYYLSYNAVKGLKFTSQGVDELTRLQLNLFYNPDVRFLSGTSVLDFQESSNIKQVNLDSGLIVKGFGKSQVKELQLFHRDDTYFLLGQGLNRFSFYYAGSIEASGDAGEQLRLNMKAAKGEDRYYILSRDQNFYPNPGNHFFRSRVKISVPSPMLCLASGSLSSQQRVGERSEFIFESPGTKGISLVCGTFEKLLTIPSRLPIQVYGNPKLRLRDYFSPREIQDDFDFLLDKFGPLEIRELNLLLRRQQNFGGMSNQGFVIFNLLDSRIMDDDISRVRRIRSESPVVFTDINRDSMIHELSHQWWGGIISWKTYQDQWLTEGLAQFSTLLYLQNTMGENPFRKVLASARKWVSRRSDAGPIIYGRRIANLSDDLQTYQSIVYNKAALVFMMLREMLGEEELLKRLRQFLADFKYQSVASSRFIAHISQGDRRLQKFFAGWIYSRRLPEVHYQVESGGQNAEITFTQKDTDFVFPVSVLVTTAEGKYARTLIVEKKVQKFKIFENVPILSIQVEALSAPIDLEG